MILQTSLFVNYIDPLGGVTSWAKQVAQYLPLEHGFSLVAVKNERLRLPYSSKILRTDECQVVYVGGALKRGSYPEREIKSLRGLHKSSKAIIEKTNLYIPNQFEFGFRLAALANLEGYTSRCIGICHTDEEYYYYLLTKYAPIINTFICVSSKCRKELEERLPNRRRDINQLPYGVNIPAEKRCVGPSSPLRLLYVGRLLQRQKRVLDFIKLTKILCVRNLPFTLSFVGTGDDEANLKHSLLPYRHCVRFLGPLAPQAICNLYSKYDVLILPSETEGISIAMLESMANGLVPIVTHVSGAEDLIDDGINGFLFQKGDLHQAANRVELLVRSSALWLKMSSAAQKTIRNHYSDEQHFHKLESIINRSYQKTPASYEAARYVLNDPRTFELPT